MNRNKFLLGAIVAFIFISGGCKKSSDTGCGFTESTIVAPASEIATLQAWVTANHPGAVQHPSGLFYEITNPGSGTTPSVCSNITFKYTGYLTNGVKFEENLTGVTYVLGQLIPGFQKGIPLIKKFGTINLFIPPSLGYGSNQVGSIPPNSILQFAVQLMEVQ
ncbi:MAG TPA: FKBP-type peptidyl-prolyl cis-trans isomerase [Ferruginibacter sp.]|nr:FKBP-type peptidyl-prolyl cis-trans isomerase [Ferruginibacter sp.]